MRTVRSNMEQYQYRLNQEPILKPQNQFLRIWSPLFIKWGIAVAVSMASGMIFEVIVIARESGADLKSIQDIYQLQAAFEQYMGRISDSAELAREMAQEFIKYATPIEGFAALITIPVMFFMFHRDRVREKESGFVPNNKAALWKYAGIFILALAVTLGLNNIIEISGIYEMSESYEETMEALYAASLPMQIACLGVLIPVCEELVFRGLMFRRVRQEASFLRAAVYSSCVFGFLHGNFVQILYGFFMGFMFCYLYEKYGSVKAPAFAHMTANIFSVVMTETKVLDRIAERPLYMGAVTVICASTAAAVFVLIQRIEEKPQEALSENASGKKE